MTTKDLLLKASYKLGLALGDYIKQNPTEKWAYQLGHDWSNQFNLELNKKDRELTEDEVLTANELLEADLSRDAEWVNFPMKILKIVRTEN